VIKNKLIVAERAQFLRRNGFSHRQISKKLSIAIGTAFLLTKGINLSYVQHIDLLRKSGTFKLPHKKRVLWGQLARHKIKHTQISLIKIVKEFYLKNGRIPTKQELSRYNGAFRRVFGSWNKGIAAANYKPNPEMFTHKFIAKDGHACDSLSKQIVHERGIFYPNQKLFKTDFYVDKKYWIEFLGLKGVVKKYDLLYERKKQIAKENGIEIVELYPGDLFPRNQLGQRLGFLVQ